MNIRGIVAQQKTDLGDTHGASGATVKNQPVH